MARIYVSSTFSDLKEHRIKVGEALRRLGHDDVAMEYYVAEDSRPLDRCLADVESCDVYVGIFAFRFGFIPEDNNPEKRSITELEYRKAREKGKPCLIFLVPEDAPWPLNKVDKGDLWARINSLREELDKNHVRSDFQTVDELTRKVNEAVINWEKQSGKVGARARADWQAYRTAIYDRHQWVRLQVIAGVSKNREPVRIPLTEVFEPQLVAAGVSGTDVPDEYRKQQEDIYRSGSQPQELTSSETEETNAEDFGQPETDDGVLSANFELVMDMLARESTQVILGGPGSGKSTILHYAMLRLCQPETERDPLPAQLQGGPIPFLVELRNYVLQKDPDFVSHIVNRIESFYATPIDAESVVSLLRQDGKALVFFDGLDEVFDPNERKRVIEQFQTFTHLYPTARILVTSRIAGYDRAALGLITFKHYTLLPLTVGQIRNFATHWYKYFTLEGTERTAQGLVRRIIESPRLLDLAGNPLLLTMMAVIYRDRDLPGERSKLYQRCADTLLEDWDVGKGIKGRDFDLKVEIGTDGKSQILQRVAMYMLERGQSGRELNAIAYEPLLDIVARFLEEKFQKSRGEAEAIGKGILVHLMERTYVLAGIGERVFGFVHRTFMEYFAALHIKVQFYYRGSDFEWLTREIFRKHWRGGDWEEVLLLLIAILQDQGTQVRAVLEFVQTKCRTTPPLNVAFAARCMGETGHVQDKAFGQALLTDLAQAISEYVPQIRKDKARTFVDAGLTAFATLAPLVTPPTPEVQQAIDKLNETGTDSARITAWQMGFALRSRDERLPYALAALKDPEFIVRRGAIAALEREWPGRADIGPALSEVVKNDRQARVRQAALSTMQRAWRHEPTILEAIASRADEETGHRSVIALIEYLALTWQGNARARDLVFELAGHKPKARSNYDYSSVLFATISRLAAGWKGDNQALVFLKEHAENGSLIAIREAAFQSISFGWGGNREALAFLMERAVKDPEHAVRHAVFRAIGAGWNKDPRALSYMLDRASNDPNPENRRSVFQALARSWSGNAQAFEVLQDRAARDPEPQNRANALSAIVNGWLDDAKGVAFLTNHAANNPDPEIRKSIISELGSLLSDFSFRWQFLDRSAKTETIKKILFDRARNDLDSEVRLTAVRTIGAISDPFYSFGGRQLDILAFLSAVAANDPSVDIRVVAHSALNYLRNDFDGFGNRVEWPVENLEFLKEQATTNGRPLIRSYALWAIADGWSSGRTFSFLSDRARNDSDPQTRLDGVRAMAWAFHNNPDIVSLFRDLISTDSVNRPGIAEVLENLDRNVRSRYQPGFSYDHLSE